MANSQLFRSVVGKLFPKTDSLNHEGAAAYRFIPREALAQYAATGCLNGTFYADAGTQLERVLDLCRDLDVDFIAKTALYAREMGFMKDMPALLCAILTTKGEEGRMRLEGIFPRVIDNGKMLRNFVQILRSGAVGRKSLGTMPRRLVRRWLESRSAEAVFAASVGQDPSLADIVRMVHPKPADEARAAIYGYLLGLPCKTELLPDVVRRFEGFKRGDRAEVPDVPFQFLTALNLGTSEWTSIAERASWQMTRMNLNTFARHGVFEDEGATNLIANRLRDPKAIEQARVFPYQVMTSYNNLDEAVPVAIREAIQDALELTLAHVPALEGKVYVCPDVSGSMRSPITGRRRGATSTVRCVDVAAMVAATILRKNRTADVIPFETGVVQVVLNPRDTVATNAERLAAIGGGGTNCSAPLALLNRRRAAGDLVVLVSDNQSWVDGRSDRTTGVMREWNSFVARNPGARLVCLDLTPYETTQAPSRDDLMNIGGFSDKVFELMALFSRGMLAGNRWVSVIEEISL